MQKTIGIGMIGHAFMGKTHSIGYRDVSVIGPVDVPRPRLVCVCETDSARLKDAQFRFGWERGTDDWRALIADPEIDLIDNVAPNNVHVEPMIAAAKAGKHLYCEKPLAPTAEQTFEMWKAADQAGVIHMCAFNYRFFPALQLARRMIQSGDLGEIYHYRSNFLLSSSLFAVRKKTWRDDPKAAGAGALGDLGSHHIDVSRFLLDANPVRAIGLTRIAIGEAEGKARIGTDDMFAALLEYGNGAVGVLEASRVAGGNLVTSRIEIDGSKGSIRFSMQRLNELEVAGADRSFRTISVIREGDPYQEVWFPAGHPLGWVDTISHEAVHVLGAVAGLHEVAPIGATFKDGYYCAEIVDAVLRSSQERRAIDITYRAL